MVLYFFKKMLPMGSTSQAVKVSKRPKLFRPLLEVLEDRLVLATRTWDGTDGTAWTNRLNWEDNIAPVAGDDLVFGDATNLVSFNNFASDTAFNSIKISREYHITGNRIILGTGGLTATDSTNGGDENIIFEAPMSLTSSSGPISVSQGVDWAFPTTYFTFTETKLFLTGASRVHSSPNGTVAL